MQKSDAQPQLSIIVPTINEADQMADLSAHLLHWQRKGCEVVLVDGGSTDGSAELAAAAGLTVLPAPCGRARQMNAGARQAESDVLLFLHADTRLPADADTLVLNALSGGKKCWGRFDVCIAGDAFMFKVVSWFMNRRSRLTGIATGDQAIFVSREVFLESGGFADQPLMEDIELSTRLRRLSRPACLRRYVTTSGRRWLTRGIWHTIWLMWCLRWAYWRGTPASQLAERYR